MEFATFGKRSCGYFLVSKIDYTEDMDNSQGNCTGRGPSLPRAFGIVLLFQFSYNIEYGGIPSPSF